MPYFKDEAEVYRYIGGIFTEVLADPELGAEFKATEVIMGLHFTGPTSHLIIDAVEGKVYTGAECDSASPGSIESCGVSRIRLSVMYR